MHAVFPFICAMLALSLSLSLFSLAKETIHAFKGPGQCIVQVSQHWKQRTWFLFLHFIGQLTLIFSRQDRTLQKWHPLSMSDRWLLHKWKESSNYNTLQRNNPNRGKGNTATVTSIGKCHNTFRSLLINAFLYDKGTTSQQSRQRCCRSKWCGTWNFHHCSCCVLLLSHFAPGKRVKRPHKMRIISFN